MKKLLLAVILLVATNVTAQENYYAQLKKVTKVKGKTTTETTTVSVTINEEYKSVYISGDEPTRYKILEKSVDEKTSIAIYKLTLKEGEGITTDATISATSEKATYENLKTGKKIIFDSRTRPGIKIN